MTALPPDASPTPVNVPETVPVQVPEIVPLPNVTAHEIENDMPVGSNVPLQCITPVEPETCQLMAHVPGSWNSPTAVPL